MFGNLFKVEVTENEVTNIVTINNINARALLKDLEKVWNTSVISTYMVITNTRSYIKLHSFFVPDFFFCISRIKDYTRMRVNENQLDEIIIGLQTNTWFKSYFQKHTNILDFSKLRTLKFTAKPLQLEAIHAYNDKIPKLRLNGMLLGADAGSGKTYMGIAISACLDASHVVIFCPKSLLESVWINGIIEQFGNTKKIYRSDQNQILDNSYDYYVFNYETINKALDLVTRYKLGKISIILDESHNLNDVKSLRTSTYLDFCRISNCKNILHASGTALKALGIESIPLFRAIDPLFKPKVEEAFTKIYGRSAKRALEVLNNRLGMVQHKISKADIMADLPTPISIEIKIKLPDPKRYLLSTLKLELQDFIKERTAYYDGVMEEHTNVYLNSIAIFERNGLNANNKEQYVVYTDYVIRMRKSYDNRTMGHMSTYCNNFEKTFIAPCLSPEQKKRFNDSKSVYKYVQLKIMGEFLGGLLGKRRTELHNELVHHSGIEKIIAQAEKKTILFTNYVDTALVADKFLKEKGFSPLIVYGKTNNELISILDKFRNDNGINPLIATIQSMSTGVTVIEANTVIFLNQPFRSFEKEQACARVYRIGQNAQVYFYDILLDTGEEPNLSTRLMEIQQWSQDQVNLMLGDVSYNDSIGMEGIDVDMDKYKRDIIFNW